MRLLYIIIMVLTIGVVSYPVNGVYQEEVYEAGNRDKQAEPAPRPDSRQTEFAYLFDLHK